MKKDSNGEDETADGSRRRPRVRRLQRWSGSASLEAVKAGILYRGVVGKLIG